MSQQQQETTMIRPVVRLSAKIFSQKQNQLEINVFIQVQLLAISLVILIF